jgi:hypothetical protein
MLTTGRRGTLLVTSLTACLLEHEPASEWEWQLKAGTAEGAAKASLKRAIKWLPFDTKPGELPMGRVKVR